MSGIRQIIGESKHFFKEGQLADLPNPCMKHTRLLGINLFLNMGLNKLTHIRLRPFGHQFTHIIFKSYPFGSPLVLMGTRGGPVLI